MSATEANYPFNKPTADLTVCSSDNVNFGVHRIILAEASPVFETTFQLPQPLDAQNHHVVSLTEESGTLDKLFRICYPVPDPPLDCLEDVEAVLAAAAKYDMDEAQAVCKKALLDADLVQRDPVGVYAIASQPEAGRCDACGRSTNAPLSIRAAGFPVPHFGETPRDSYCYNYDCFRCRDEDGLEHEPVPAGWVTRRYSLDVDVKDYLSYAAELMEVSPCGDALVEDAELGSCRFVESSLPACKDCRRDICTLMRDWRNSLAEDVKGAIAQQQLQIAF
ncbi:hypothetical protein SCP_0601280 [Sparassis crispa]|uniref:BTB domain-containing protein n=1 Tax=Sparassis crispa TaxID=139825 RepID=A0A401GPR4_9APHY|nr:hypothetical protein SCP_0601280 [Sparassis crispa]GBE84150.1 hypothetical protein SCP_0601280 [Sparassis crispa]